MCKISDFEADLKIITYYIIIIIFRLANDYIMLNTWHILGVSKKKSIFYFCLNIYGDGNLHVADEKHIFEIFLVKTAP